MGRTIRIGVPALAAAALAVLAAAWWSGRTDPTVVPPSVPGSVPVTPIVPSPAGAAPPAAPVFAGDGVLLGRLVRGCPPRPLAGAVEVASRSATAGPDGRFRVEALPRGIPLDLTARAEGLPEARLAGLRIPAGGPFDVGDVLLGPAEEIRVLVRGASGAPLEGATVGLHPAAREDLGEAPRSEWKLPPEELLPETGSRTTDAAGQAVFPDVASGDWRVRVSAPGHATAVRAAWVREGFARAPLEFRLRPGCVLSGSVLGPDGQPVPGAALEAGPGGLDPAGGRRVVAVRTRSDATGRYALEGLPEGPAEVRWLPAPGSERWLGRVVLPVPGGFDLRLPPVADLSGVVVEEETGAPVAGAEVSVSTHGGSFGDVTTFSAATRSDAEGRFLVAGAPEGVRSGIRVSRAGFLRYPAAGQRVPEPRESGPEGLRLALRRGSAIRGRVATTDGAPVPGALVWAVPYLGKWETGSDSARIGDPTRRVRAGEDGSFRLDAVPPGRALLLAEAPGFVQQGATPWVRSLDAGIYGNEIPEALLVDVPGEGEAVHDLVLLRGATVEGTVFDAAGRPAAGHRVQVGTMTEGEEGEGVAGPTDAEGRFAVRGVIPGKLRFVWASGPSGAQGWSEKFDLEDGEKVSGLKVVVKAEAAGAVLSGTVRFADGAPAAGAEIRLDPWGATVYRTFWDDQPPLAVTGPDGAFRIANLREGTCSVLVRGPGMAPTAGPRVSLRASGGPANVEVVVPRGRSIAGRVVDSAGRPIPGASVVVSPVEPGEGAPKLHHEFESSHGSGPRIPLSSRATATAGAGGEFRQEGLEEGEYWVEASSPTGLDAWVRARAGEESVEVRLGEAFSIEGRAIDDATGEPAVDVPVFWFNPSGDRVSAEGEWIRTAADGSFRIRGLAPGLFRVNVASHLNDADLPWEEVDLEDVKSGTTDLVVRLRKGLALAGRVVDQAGRPVAKATVKLSPQKERGRLEFFMGKEVVTGEDGSFRYDGLAAGTYGLQAGKGRMDSGAPGDADIVLTVVRDLQAGNESVVVRVVRGLTITGRVVAADGRPAQGRPNAGNPRVELLPPKRDPGAEEEDGEEEGPARITVFVGRKDESSFESPPLEPGSVWDLVASDFREGPVGIVRGVAAGTKDVVVRLQPGFAIEGRVQDEQGAAAPQGLLVKAEKVGGTWEHGEREYVSTGPNGTFRIEGLAEGTFAIVVDERREVFLPAKEPLHVKAGTAGVVVVLRRGATVTGKVVDAAGKPLRYPQVQAKDGNGARSEEDGTFSLGGLEPGEEVVLVVQVGDSEEEIEAGPFRAPASGVEVRLPAR